MAKWLPPVLLLTTFALRTTRNLESEDACQTHLSVSKWPQLTCTDVDSDYFRRFTRPLNRTHWIRCVNCSLKVIDEKTFHFAIKNNVSVVELPACQVGSLKKSAFGRFFLLKFLNLKNNKIEYLEPKCFAGLKRLLQLDLSSNFLKILTNNIFSDLVNLDVLNLNGNQIFYVQPYAFVGLQNLKYLYANNNELKKLEDRMFRHLTNLKILYMEHNGIVEMHQNAFANLRNLNYLYLNNNSISFLVQYNFKPLTSLVDLQLRSNNLREIQVSSFNGLRNLKYLHLGNNRIGTVKPYGFIGLDSLAVLDLVNNNFTIVDFDYFDKIEHLRVLWLNDNFITEFRVDPRAEVQTSLALVDLSRNDLSQFNFSLFYKKMPNIKEIVLTNNSFSCDFFSNMYSFYRTKNVSICVSDNCALNDTELYLDSLCYLATDDVVNSTDSSTDCTAVLDANVPVSLMCTALFLFLFC